MINRAETGKMPGYNLIQGEMVKALEPTMIDIMGKDTLCLHVGFAGAALVGRDNSNIEQVTAGDGAEITLVLARPGQLGLLHTMSIEQARAIATSLQCMAETVEAAAATAATAALKKAAGK